jgi:hypothetical protein
MMPKRVAVNGTKTLKATESVQVVPENKQRKYMDIGGSQTVGMWLGFGVAAVVGSGAYIPPGAAYVIDADNLYQGAINAILANGGDQAIGFLELS